MTTASQSPSSAAFLAQARQDTQMYRRSALIEELMRALEAVASDAPRGPKNGPEEDPTTAMERRFSELERHLRSQRKHISPVLAKLIVHLERQ